MSEVKVGDWVRYVGDGRYGLTHGEEYQVTEVDFEDEVMPIEVNCDGVDLWISKDDFKTKIDIYTRILEAMLGEASTMIAKRIAEELK